jgi:F-type H+-transporting ATPase subunit delta
MSAVKIASRYARAFLNLAREQGVLDKVFDDLSYVHADLTGSRELQLFIQSPVIKGDDKQKVFSQLYAGKLSDITAGYLRLVVSKSRESYLPAIISSFIAMYNEMKGIKHVTVTSATSLTAEEEAILSDKLKEATGANEIKMEKLTDPALIGGFVIHMGDRVYDTSVSHKLQQLKKQLINA